MTTDHSRMLHDRARQRQRTAHTLVRVAGTQHSDEATFNQARELSIREQLHRDHNVDTRRTRNSLVRVAAVPSPGIKNTLRLVNSSGQFVWKRRHYQGVDPASSNATHGIAVSGDVIVSSGDPNSSNQRVVGAWDQTGSLLWSYDASTGVRQAGVLDNGNFVFQQASGTIICLRQSDGLLLWTNTDPVGITALSRNFAIIGNDIGVIGDDGTETYTFWRIDGTDGTTAFTDSYTTTGTKLSVITAGGFGTYTANRLTGSFPTETDTFEGLDANGALNGTGFTVTRTNPFMIAPSPAGNLLIASVGAVRERTSSGTLVQSDTTSFAGSQVGLAIDDAGNIYAFGGSQDVVGELKLVKYDGDDLTTIDWEHTFVSSLQNSSAAKKIALHSPSSNAAPVIGYDLTTD